MKTAELRELSLLELEKKLRDTRQQLLNLRMRKQTGQVEHPHELRLLRREVARLLTLINQKRRAHAVA